LAAHPNVLLFLWALAQLSTWVLATPQSYAPHLYTRKTTTTISHSSNGSIIVLDPDTEQSIPQGLGTDGGGSGFSAPAIIWIGVFFVIGAPLSVAGIRGWRCTTGVALGLASIVCAWAAIINSVNQTGISDLLLTIIVLAFGFLGVVIGVFEFARISSMAALCISGGLAFGMRIALIKKNLLITPLALNWAVIVVFGVANGLFLIWHRRAAMLIACASTGTFLLSLAVDLIINQQSGLSIGLRSVFDNNDNHVAYFAENSYDPRLSTRVILIVSLGLTPVLAFAQHRMFKAPFIRREPPSDEDLCLNYPTEDNGSYRATVFLSGLWDGAKFKMNANRFSV